MTEVPEQLLAALDRIHGRATPDEVLRRINAATVGHAQPDLTPSFGASRASRPLGGTHRETLPCPFCDVPMPVDEVVCRSCRQYVNQVTANGDAEDMAPVPMLHSPDRRYRFDALWRLVFADDEVSLVAVREAVPTWPRADRLLSVNAFAEVADPRPAAFLELIRPTRTRPCARWRARCASGAPRKAAAYAEGRDGAVPVAPRPKRPARSCVHARMASQSRSSWAGSPCRGLAGERAIILSLKASRAGS